jgi:hypothetical protein
VAYRNSGLRRGNAQDSFIVKTVQTRGLGSLKIDLRFTTQRRLDDDSSLAPGRSSSSAPSRTIRIGEFDIHRCLKQCAEGNFVAASGSGNQRCPAALGRDRARETDCEPCRDQRFRMKDDGQRCLLKCVVCIRFDAGAGASLRPVRKLANFAVCATLSFCSAW